jgi:hypothetical protein
MKKKRYGDIPEFKSLEEEREYWEARGPLADGHKGTINKPNLKKRPQSAMNNGKTTTKRR